MAWRPPPTEPRYGFATVPELVGRPMILVGTSWATPMATWESPLPGGRPGQVQVWYLLVTQPDGQEVLLMAEVRVIVAVRGPAWGTAAGR